MTLEDFPISSPSISLCMIVKNEADNLERCLSSAQTHIDELIVVDTGSEDATLEIAQRFGAHISHFQWCHDFAAARNYSLAQASGDWILVLDADEELLIDPTLNPDRLKAQLAAQPDVLAYTLPLTEVTEDDTDLQAQRLFRNQANLQYVGRYHEQLTVQLSQQQRLITGLKIRHYGYSNAEAVFQKCVNRNIPLLEQVRQEDGLTLTLLYTLAGMYAHVGQTEKVHNCYTELFERLLPNLVDGTPPNEFQTIPSVIYTLGIASLQQQDYDTASLLAQRGIQWCQNHPGLHYLAGQTLKALGFSRGAIPYFEYSLELYETQQYYNEGEPIQLNLMTTYPAYEIGCLYLDLGQISKAKHALERALTFDPQHQPSQQALAQLQK